MLSMFARTLAWCVVGFAWVATAGCKKINPETCCETMADCAALGVTDFRPCKDGLACVNNFCEPAECLSSNDCASTPGMPICERGLCVAACTTDDECTMQGRSVCDMPSGVCVECTMDMQCSGDHDVCDDTTHTCRGCKADAECASGVCDEPIATCVADTSNVIFVRPDGTDTGTCTSAAPCKTLTYAVQKVTATRNFIHIDGAALPATATTVTLANDLTIDGTLTQLAAPLDGKPALTLTSAVLTLSGIGLPFPKNGSSPSLTTTNQTHLYDVTVAGDLTCSSGGLSLERTTLTNPDGFTGHALSASDCTLTIRHSRFDDVQLGVTNGTTIVENSLFLRTNSISDAVGISGPGRFDFNTVVNTSGIQNDGAALGCSPAVTAANNIFAYNSQHAITPTASSCLPTNSLFDLAEVGKANGAGSKQADASTFFIDRAGKDFHLAAGSPAIGAGSAESQVTDDIEGHPRPDPVGSNPDIGAFESSN